MQIFENVSLKLHGTMRLGGNTRYACDVTSENDLLEALKFADNKNIPVRVIGKGSNIIWQDSGYEGLLIVNKIPGFELMHDGITVCIGAGIEWDQAVKLSVDKGLSGLESLSLIPGTVGATPVQNVGAYGSEVKDTIVSLRCYDMQSKSFIELSNNECEFGYRTSRFKTTDSGRFIIMSVTFKLSLDAPQPPFYVSLQQYLDSKGVSDYSPQTIRDAVISIRTNKLPNPAIIANNGSFFANPVIEKEHFIKLRQDYPEIKSWTLQDDKVKIAAGWLIEQAGFKDYHDSETGMATWHEQSLVLVNEHATSTSQLLAFKQKIVSAVQEKFGIILEQEPELLP